eukprot:TRINITY_DN10843_c0_g1_i1.p1 TRINITY_DN10843_c0_g1~~TRINITY_DN10843_c0_g1_i1.p1  ORF type:complete len:320 (-),score=47.34 TRINITY_DN10843_c0_g1_i1:1111-2070(-)
MQALNIKDQCCNFEVSDVSVTMNLKLDACVVPLSSGEGYRVDEAHLVVLDNFIDHTIRQDILDYITQKDWDHARGPPTSKWEKKTADSALAPATWGLKGEVLGQLANCECEAIIELQTRLCKLYPEVQIFHMPSQLLHEQKQEVGSDVGFFCDQFVGNAAVKGDQFGWHEDANPASFPDCPWVDQYDRYCNRELGKPLFVSMLIYLNESWEREWDAETLFLDSVSDTGVFVRPKSGRIVLMDQDIVHRLSSPSNKAETARYSLVWKLVFASKDKDKKVCLARPEWGRPTAFGSAHKLQNLTKQISKKANNSSQNETKNQ